MDTNAVSSNFDVINYINSNASKIKEEEIDTLVKSLLSVFSNKINYLSSQVYGGSDVALSAFKEHASQKLKHGVESYIFKYEHWRSRGDITPYLHSCLSRMATSLKDDISFTKKVSIPICPACKALGSREYLTNEDRLLRCACCTTESDRLSLIENRSQSEEYEYRIRTVFSLHSRKGKRCPECSRFIPISLMSGSRASCPFDNCSWFGDVSSMEQMIHPLGQSSGVNVSMSTPISDNFEIGDTFDANCLASDMAIEKSQELKREYDIVKNVIQTQRMRVENTDDRSKVIKKIFMYKAFESFLEQDPGGMVGYLIRGKAIGERPIQSMVFQKYVQLVENSLPFNISGPDGNTEVYSLMDSNLELFHGVSEFNGFISANGVIQNNTKEVFVGVKCNGPCFIGYLCSIVDEDGNDLMPYVDYYGFSNIKLNKQFPEGTKVKVTHFRIPPHYEMFSLVNFQRVRKKIVESIRKRIEALN